MKFYLTHIYFKEKQFIKFIFFAFNFMLINLP